MHPVAQWATLASKKTKRFLIADQKTPIAGLTWGPSYLTRHWILQRFEDERELHVSLSRLYAALSVMYDWKTVDGLRAGKFLPAEGA